MKKLIIIGAGACIDFDFPSGIGLLKEIHALWDNPDDAHVSFYLHVMEKLNKIYGYKAGEEKAKIMLKHLSHRLYYSSAESIDDFLSQCSNEWDVSFGKLAILNLILDKENKARLSTEGKNLFKWEENWLRVLFGRDFRYEDVNILEKKLKEERVGFLIFNYDRSIEHFLFSAFTNYYDLPQDRVKQLLSHISFTHVYGQLAPLEWQENDPNKVLRYGDDFKDFPYNKMDKLYQCSSNIKIIKEDRENFESIKNVHLSLVKEAQRVYILGFGFQAFNYQLLGIEEYKAEGGKLGLPMGKFVYTTFGLSESQKNTISLQYFGRYMGTENQKSYDSKIYDYILHHY